jgi:gamma-glutamylcysteine synthetase
MHEVVNSQVRLKKFVEMRGADVGPLSHVLALPALWVGLIYDSESKAAALDLTRNCTRDEIKTLRREARSALICMLDLSILCSTWFHLHH